MKRLEYNAGDLVRRYQPAVKPGIKKKLSRMWTGPWVITEKLSDVLYRIQHEKNAPSVVIHADNIKPYRGSVKINWFKVSQNPKEAEEPKLQYFEEDNVCVNEAAENTLSGEKENELSEEIINADDKQLKTNLNDENDIQSQLSVSEETTLDALSNTQQHRYSRVSFPGKRTPLENPPSPPSNPTRNPPVESDLKTKSGRIVKKPARFM